MQWVAKLSAFIRAPKLAIFMKLSVTRYLMIPQESVYDFFFLNERDQLETESVIHMNIHATRT